MNETVNAEVEIVEDKSLAIRPEQQDWTPAQAQALFDMFGIGDAPIPVIQGYFHLCKTTGLDPFKRQIHLIERQGKWTPQTSIDGFRLIRDRSGIFRGMEKFWFGDDEEPRKFWPASRGTPAGAVVYLHLEGLDYPIEGVAFWEEYVQTKRDGTVTSMWANKGRHMLMKCAEALAIRSAFPDDTGGLYSDDEMAQASNGEPDRPAHGGGGRQRSPGIMDLEEPPVTTSAAYQQEQTVGGGFMDANPPAAESVEDPNIEDAEVVDEPVTAPEAAVAAPPAPEPVPEAPQPAEVAPGPENAAPEAEGAPMDMAPAGNPEPNIKYLWASKLAIALEDPQFDLYKLRVIFDEAAAAGTLGDTVPWSGLSFEQTVMAIRTNLEAGKPAEDGIR